MECLAPLWMVTSVSTAWPLYNPPLFWARLHYAAWYCRETGSQLKLETINRNLIDTKALWKYISLTITWPRHKLTILLVLEVTCASLGQRVAKRGVINNTMYIISSNTNYTTSVKPSRKDLLGLGHQRRGRDTCHAPLVSYEIPCLTYETATYWH